MLSWLSEPPYIRISHIHRGWETLPETLKAGISVNLVVGPHTFSELSLDQSSEAQPQTILNRISRMVGLTWDIWDTLSL